MVGVLGMVRITRDSGKAASRVRLHLELDCCILRTGEFCVPRGTVEDLPEDVPAPEISYTIFDATTKVTQATTALTQVTKAVQDAQIRAIQNLK